MKKYAVNFNNSGYMPDGDGFECDTLAEAKECLLEDITHYLEDLNLDDRYTDEQVKEFVHYQEEIERAPAQELNARIGAFNFYIAEI